MTMYPLTCSSVLSRRLMLGLLAAQFAMLMLIGNAQAAGLDEIKKRGLIVATEDDFRPFEFVKDGKPTGFDNELIEDLRTSAPFEVKQEILPWTGILAGVSTGNMTSPLPRRSSPRSANSRSISPARSPTPRTTMSSARTTSRFPRSRI